MFGIRADMTKSQRFDPATPYRPGQLLAADMGVVLVSCEKRFQIGVLIRNRESEPHVVDARRDGVLKR